ncbi:hypothetical protein D8Y22_11095 [Salinadaptatus halalkaliphilus]|uniref:Halobacterial output domain-containing protein n=1 Tax=Salinadaptatus halalkaliphilus TaxID=2419781 RepID=A0A4S3TL57_9EURY|nr:HalOD1 output domain-containing protein [Salinadaptatus halalkaliphilus]THE64796.1 hypothetical protein D8Y22_11095 [Salinadaptatus halalkaliphilus]
MSPPDDSPSTGGTVPPSQAIIERVAQREGVDVTDIEPPAYEPLYAVVNPDALDALFQSASRPNPVRVTLEYEGYDIVVHSDGDVDVSETPPSDDSPDSAIEE